MVAYGYLDWTEARKKQIADYLGRGGGLVLVHSSTWTKPKADTDVAALVGVGGFTRFRHGQVRVELTDASHTKVESRCTASVLALESRAGGQSVD